MSRSAFVEVNITNSTKLAQDSQNTADKAVKGVENLNDPNMMSVIEKQNNIVQFSGLTSQYNVLVENAKAEGIDTAAITKAYNDLNRFMIDILADPNHASVVDREVYKKYQGAYNRELSRIQTALQNNTDKKFTSAASAAESAASTASQASSQAQSAVDKVTTEMAAQSEATANAQKTADSAFAKAEAVGNQTSAEIAKQSAAITKAQSTADSAFKQAQSAADYTDKQIASQASVVSEASKKAAEASTKANSALDTANGANAEITKLKGGSTLTIAQLEDGLGSKVSNADFTSYKTQTASQFAQTVKQADFKTYQTQTSKLIESKVSNEDYEADKTQTAQQIASKVSSSEFQTYQAQTDKAIKSKVSSSDYESDKEQTASQIADKVSSGEFSTYKTQTDKLIGQKVDNGDFKTYQTQTSKLIESKVDNGTYQADKTQTANQIASKVSSTDFNSYKTQTDKAIQSKVSSADFAKLKVGGRNLYLKSKTIEDGYNPFNATVKVERFDDTTNMWHVTAGKGTGTRVGLYLNNYGNGKIPNNSDWAYSADVKGTGKVVWFGIEAGDHKPITGTVGKDWSRISQTGHVDDGVKTIIMYFDSTDSAVDVYIKLPKLESGNMPSDWSLAPEDTATQSEVTQLSGQISSKVSSSDFNSYKVQTDKLIADKVSNGTFSTYKSQTAELIAQKVATKDFEAYQSTTAQQIASKVASSDFNSYKSQTDKAIQTKVSKGDANNVNLIPYSAMPKAGVTKWFGRGGGNQFQVTTHPFYHNGADHLYEINTTSANEVYAMSPRFKIKANSTYTFQLKGFASANVKDMDVFVLGRKNGETKDYTVAKQIILGAKLSTSGMDYRKVTFTTGDMDEAYIRIDNNGSSDGKIAILGFTELKLEPGDTATPYVYGAEQSMISQVSDDINLRVTKDGLIDQINLSAGKTLISSGGQLTLSGKSVFLDSTDPVIMKSANIDRLLVGKQLTAADISANTFSTNNGTFTVDKNGAITAKNMTLSGGKLSSPTINAGTISGATINGTTFHGGDVINSTHNTSHLYPMTISPNGEYKSTFFDQAVGLQSSIASGAIQHKYRSMLANSSGQFPSYNAAIDGQGFHSQAGYTTTKDSNFDKPQTITGYVDVTPATGIYLSGPTQQVSFAGNGANAGSNGITMNTYGNIKGMQLSATWGVNSQKGKVAEFGIDPDGKNTIGFYRPTFVDEIGALTNNNSGRLFLHDKKGDAQIIMSNDGKPRVVSATIYNRTYSNEAHVCITKYGTMGRISSASKYKLAISREPRVEPADRLLTITPSSWVDLESAKEVAAHKTDERLFPEPEQSLNRCYGLIAEDLRDAGLDEFLIYGKDNEIEGVQYDKLWTVLIPKIKQMNERINELERKSL